MAAVAKRTKKKLSKREVREDALVATAAEALAKRLGLSDGPPAADDAAAKTMPLVQDDVLVLRLCIADRVFELRFRHLRHVLVDSRCLVTDMLARARATAGHPDFYRDLAACYGEAVHPLPPNTARAAADDDCAVRTTLAKSGRCLDIDTMTPYSWAWVQEALAKHPGAVLRCMVDLLVCRRVPERVLDATSQSLLRNLSTRTNELHADAQEDLEEAAQRPFPRRLRASCRRVLRMVILSVPATTGTGALGTDGRLYNFFTLARPAPAPSSSSSSVVAADAAQRTPT